MQPAREIAAVADATAADLDEIGAVVGTRDRARDPARRIARSERRARRPGDLHRPGTRLLPLAFPGQRRHLLRGDQIGREPRRHDRARQPPRPFGRYRPIHGRHLPDVGDDRREIVVREVGEAGRGHEQERAAVRRNALPQGRDPIRVAIVAGDAALPSRQVRGVEPTDQRIVGHLASGEIGAMTVGALGDDRDEMAAPLEQRRIGREGEARGRCRIPMPPVQPLLAARVDRDDDQSDHARHAREAGPRAQPAPRAARPLTHPASAAMWARASKA
ncbi:MAG: hypothetical protein R3F21_06510 [Myxococcota bacterium]